MAASAYGPWGAFAAGVATGFALHRILVPHPGESRLIALGPQGPPPPETPTSLPELHAHLAIAVRLELATIPPYLYASYSLKDEDHPAARACLSVALEEMLHLTSACNLLLATGAPPPRVSVPGVAPLYPVRVPNRWPVLTVDLRPLSIEALDQFLSIEQPHADAAAAARAGPAPVPTGHAEQDYPTIGQFYEAIEHCLATLDARDPTLFANARPDQQLWWFHAPSPGNRPVDRIDHDSFNVVGTGRDPELGPVRNVQHALNAIRSIIRQGEGSPGASPWSGGRDRALAHFYKFRAIKQWYTRGRDDNGDPFGARDVWPCATNPVAEQFPEGPRELARLGNALYTLMLRSLDVCYATPRQQRGRLEDRNFRDLMPDLVAPIARRLATMPLGDGTNAGLPFARFDFSASPDTPKEQLRKLFHALRKKDRDALEGCGDGIDDLVDVPA